jgi:hypothetical protein
MRSSRRRISSIACTGSSAGRGCGRAPYGQCLCRPPVAHARPGPCSAPPPPCLLASLAQPPHPPQAAPHGPHRPLAQSERALDPPLDGAPVHALERGGEHLQEVDAWGAPGGRGAQQGNGRSWSTREGPEKAEGRLPQQSLYGYAPFPPTERPPVIRCASPSLSMKTSSEFVMPPATFQTGQRNHA